MTVKAVTNDANVAVTDEFFRDRKDWPRWVKTLTWILRENDAEAYVNLEDLTEKGAPIPLKYPQPEFTPFQILSEESRAKLPALLVPDGAATPPERTSCTRLEFYQVATDGEMRSLEAVAKNFHTAEKTYRQEKAKVNKVLSWITGHVERTIYYGVPTDANLHQIVTYLYQYAAVDSQFEKDRAIADYDKILKLAGRSMSQEAWYARWSEAYNTIRVIASEEVTGIRAIRRFLAAAAHYNSQYCAIALVQAEQEQYTKKDAKSVLHYAEIFRHTSENGEAAAGSKFVGNVFQGKDKDGEARDRECCVCGMNKHSPTNCYAARTILLGENHTVNPKRLEETKKNLEKNKWAWLVKKIKEEKPSGNGNGNGNDSAGSGANKPQFPAPSALVGAVLPAFNGSVSAMNTRRHRYANSTIWDTGATTHVANSRDLLVPGSFVKAAHDDWISVGDSTMQVVGRGKRILKKVCHGPNGNNTLDLTLEDVALVPNFHVNIVSGTLIRKSDLWLCGLDNTIRWGSLENSTIIISLQLIEDLHFVEYKPLSSYYLPLSMPTSDDGSIALPPGQAVNSVIRRIFHRSKEHVRERADSEELWHLRAGHLNAEALAHIVENAQGIKITGIKMPECDACSVAKAKNQVSRRAPNTKSMQPFYRISLDIFKQPKAYSDHEYFIPIEEEYSSYAWLITFQNKSDGPPLVKRFIYWVREQFGLSVCKIRMDKDSAFIAHESAKNKTAFEDWCAEEGIDLELTPTATSEPNGANERLGGILKTISRAMLISANLPEILWVESCSTANYLRNRSPQKHNDWVSPLEIFLAWFRAHHRWFEPRRLVRLEQDLRPNWSNLRAFGCRAYPLEVAVKRKEEKLYFNNNPRAQIGYLVGYTASNIYRVWIPALESVINSRDVTFNENAFFDPAEQQTIGIPIEVYQRFAEALSLPDTDVFGDHEPLFEAEDAEETPEVILDTIVVATDHEPEPPLDENNDPSTNEASEHHNSGVELPPGGLMTPESSPEPTRYLDEDRSGSGSYSGPSTDQTETFCHDVTHQPSLESQAQHLADTALLEGQQAAETAPPAPIEIENNDPPSDPSDHDSDSQPSRDPSAPSSYQPPQVTDEPPPAEQAQPRRSGRERKKTERGKESEAYLRSQQQRRKPGEINAVSIPYLLADSDDTSFRTLHAVFSAAAAARPERERAPPNLPPPPKTFRDLKHHPKGQDFLKACHIELRNLLAKGTYRKIQKELMKGNNKPLPLKWVFTYKIDAEGNLIKCKARICVRGDLQPPGLEETYAHTLAARSLRTVAAIAAKFDLEWRQFDVVNAFLNSPVREGVYCGLPPGFEEEGVVLELKKALYGLRESPSLWYQEFAGFLTELQLVRSEEEPCIFVNNKVLVLFYVDDILVLYRKCDEAIANGLIQRLQKKYEMREEKEVKQYLGIRILRDRRKRRVFLCLDTYLEKIAAKFGFITSQRAPTIPIPAEPLPRSPPGAATPMEVKLFQEMVGSILYAAVMVRPDVARAASELSKHLTNPTAPHFAAAEQCIRYLYATRFLAIMYDGINHHEVLVIASDASFADDELTRRSSQGFLVQLFGGPVAWKASRQDTVTTSTTEAELLALQRTAAEATSLERFFRDISLDLGEPMKIFCDNLQTIRLVVNEAERINTRLRHVDIQNMWLKQAYRKGQFLIEYLPTNLMPADGLTKNLPRQKFEQFRAHLNLQDIRWMVLTGTGDSLTD